MFLDTLYVLLLCGLGAGVTGGVMVGRRVLNVTSRKAKLEQTKLDIEIDQLEHQRSVGVFNQQKALLQLTAGPEAAEEARKEVEKQQRKRDGRPVEVSVKPEDITEPRIFHTTEEWREFRDASDAEYA